jgi:hypothetical protein
MPFEATVPTANGRIDQRNRCSRQFDCVEYLHAMDQQRHCRFCFLVLRASLCILCVSRCCARNKIRSKEVNVKRERLTQIVLVIVGLVNLALIYFLYTDLWHSSWLLEGKNEIEPMFLSFFIPVGVFLLMAARRPSQHRSMIALAAWWNISHGVVMAIQTVEAWIHSVHRNFTDVIVFLVIGVVLLALLPAKRAVVAPAVA